MFVKKRASVHVKLEIPHLAVPYQSDSEMWFLLRGATLTIYRVLQNKLDYLYLTFQLSSRKCA